MTFSLSLMCYPVQENHITGGKLVSILLPDNDGRRGTHASSLEAEGV
jgi:hypothetical protein